MGPPAQTGETLLPSRTHTEGKRQTNFPSAELHPPGRSGIVAWSSKTLVQQRRGDASSRAVQVPGLRDRVSGRCGRRLSPRRCPRLHGLPLAGHDRPPAAAPGYRPVEPVKFFSARSGVCDFGLSFFAPADLARSAGFSLRDFSAQYLCPIPFLFRFGQHPNRLPEVVNQGLQHHHGTHLR